MYEISALIAQSPVLTNDGIPILGGLARNHRNAADQSGMAMPGSSRGRL